MEPECWFRYVGRGLAISGHGRVLSPREPYLNCCPHRATERFFLVLPLSLLKQIVVRGGSIWPAKAGQIHPRGRKYVGMLKACHPQEVSLLSLEDSPLATQLYPQLTCISWPMEPLLHQCVQRIKSIVEGRPLRETELPPIIGKLTPRQSVLEMS